MPDEPVTTPDPNAAPATTEGDNTPDPAAEAAAEAAKTREDLAAATAKNEAYAQFLQNVQAAQPAPVAPTAPAPVAPAPPATDEQFREQPAAAAQYEVNRGIRNVVGPAIQAQEVRAEAQDQRQYSLEYEMIRNGNDGELFEKYKSEIDAEFTRNPSLMRQGGAVRTVFDLVKGRHVGEIVEESKQLLLNDPAFKPAPASTPTTPTGDEEPKLTIQQIQMAKNLGVSPEDYHTWKDKYTDNQIPDWMLGVDGAERPEGE